MTELELSRRHPVSDKLVHETNDTIEGLLGVRPLPESDETLVEKAYAGDYELLLVDGQVYVVLEGPQTEDPMPTLRALMAVDVDAKAVTVDMGAVPHLRNGADVMSPGITDADPSIEEGDVVWVKDENHGAPLAIGTALVDGDRMVADESGKAISIWHHVGDDLWQIGT